MSIHLMVFTCAERLPGDSEWSAAAARAGFDLRFPEAFDWTSQKGGLPVVCDGVRACFELYADPIEEHFEELEQPPSWLERLRLSRFDVAVDFVTHSRADDRFAAVVGAATLAEATRGLLFDEPSGRYIGWRRAVRWARRTAHPPSPEDLARRERVREVVQEFVRGVLSEFGYHPIDFGQGAIRPEESWHFRPGKTVATELVEVSVYADGADSHLNVSFVAAARSLEELRRHGLEDNAAGFELFQLHSADAYRSPDPPLPPSIPVDETFPETPEAERLIRELRQADERAFVRLRELLSQH